MFSRTAFATIIVAAIALGACARGNDGKAVPTAVVVVDDVGDTIRLKSPAKRVISLIPSATESIIALGATDRIVGRTRYDVAHDVESVPSVGGGTDPSIEAIVSLHPDLVVGWTDDKRRTTRVQLARLGIPVFALRTQDTSDVFRGLGNLGKMLGRDSAATALASSIRTTLDDVHRAVIGRPRRNVMFVIYPDPPMTAGPGTFIDQLIGLAGGHSIFADLREPWPTVSMEEIVRRQPELLIVPQGEFKANAIEQLRSRHGWRSLAAVRSGTIATVSANLTQRPGANIGEAARALQAAIHPETIGATR